VRQEQFRFSVGNEKLSAIKVADDVHEAQVLFLHGAGASTKERFLWLAEALREQGIGSVLFDFSGNGESTGTMSSSSLAQRTREAQAALQHVQQPVAVLGASMGAYSAILLTQYILVQTLILFCPAIYTKEAFNVPFTAEFSRIIRKQHSWRDSDALEILERFTGNLLIVIGDDDEVIPGEVITLLDKHSPRVKEKEVMRLPKCTHNLHLCFLENPAAHDRLTNTIVRMIKGG
jgi:pimeloyl-ACP methyl ester carboxylesterase